jgi:hypothetical protein
MTQRSESVAESSLRRANIYLFGGMAIGIIGMIEKLNQGVIQQGPIRLHPPMISTLDMR